ncbi:MAG TPA: YceI family protein [Povalibacter sp.]
MTFAVPTKQFARTFAVLVLAGMLVACPKPVREPPPEKAPAPAAPATPVPDLGGATIYEVNPQASAVHILVYRGGTLARLGHNHVMSVQGLRGRIWSHPTLAKSGMSLSFPVAQLLVDDPAARRAAGSDFPPDIPQNDRDGTRRNMLREETLDAEHYPEVTLQSVSITGTLPQPKVTLKITIRNAQQDVVVVPVVKTEGARITVSGEFDILQTALGIKPFSAALGALEVQDRLHVKFSVVAEKKQS